MNKPIETKVQKALGLYQSYRCQVPNRQDTRKNEFSIRVDACSPKDAYEKISSQIPEYLFGRSMYIKCISTKQFFIVHAIGRSWACVYE